MFQPLLHRFDHGCSQWFRNLQQSSWVALLRMLLAAPHAAAFRTTLPFCVQSIPHPLSRSIQVSRKLLGL